MALAPRKIKFKIEKDSKRSRSLNSSNSIFAIYAPETIKIVPHTFKFAFLKYSTHIPDDILSTFLIMPSLREEGLKLTHYTNVNSSNRIRLEIFNNTTNKTFRLKKRTKIALFMTLNEGNEGFTTEYEKIDKMS